MGRRHRYTKALTFTPRARAIRFRVRTVVRSGFRSMREICDWGRFSFLPSWTWVRPAALRKDVTDACAPHEEAPLGTVASGS